MVAQRAIHQTEDFGQSMLDSLDSTLDGVAELSDATLGEIGNHKALLQASIKLRKLIQRAYLHNVYHPKEGT